MANRSGSSRIIFALVCASLAAVALLALPSLAGAHLERPSYWPDPAPDTSVKPATGGKVPKARPLASAVTGKGPGQVRVVCKGKRGADSLREARRSIHAARKHGFRLRPSVANRRISKRKARKLRRLNAKFAKRCRYHSIQRAVDASGNNDRIVIMPGRYTEPKSRKAPINDPRCNPSMLQKSQSGALAPSYEYQATCQNDQNLVHVTGRAVKGEPLPEPRADRHGIPKQELGRCIRCNLQIEGSGPKPEDVILDAGRGYRHPMKPAARPGGALPADACHVDDENAESPCWTKHVVLRTDRTDGFVGRNFLVRGAKEHGFYTEETDGILLDRVKFFWNADYGHLSFTTDHNLVENCDGFGSGDAVVYPGAAPQTGQFRDESFYPKRRYSTTIRRCDLHGSSMGYSGSMGNSVRVTHNHFYANANGLTTDTLSATGHPGFPADGMKIDHNWFYANNLDVYTADPAFEPLVPQPVGSGFVWAGHNDGEFAHNWVFDNWRQGTMLLGIPDEVAGQTEGDIDPQVHCPTGGQGEPVYSTSCDNHYFDNHMGQVPPGFKPHPALTKFGNKTTLGDGSQTAPNGVDFWWDEATVNTGNCWYDNTGPDGTRGEPHRRPTDRAGRRQVDSGLPARELLDEYGRPRIHGQGSTAAHLLRPVGGGQIDVPGCDWWDRPPRPGTAAARAERRREQQTQRRLAASTDGGLIKKWMHGLAGEISYGPSS